MLYGEVRDYYERCPSGKKGKSGKWKNRQRSPVCCICCFDPDHGLLTGGTFITFIYTVLRDDSGWKWALIPMFVLLFGAISYIFARIFDEFQVYGWASRCQVCVFGLLQRAGAFFFDLYWKGSKSLNEQERSRCGSAAGMVRNIPYGGLGPNVLPDADGNETGDNVGSTFYVNQTCYNFLQQRGPSSRGCMTCWQEAMTWFSGTPQWCLNSSGGNENWKKILVEINEFLQISKEILENQTRNWLNLPGMTARPGQMLRQDQCLCW